MTGKDKWLMEIDEKYLKRIIRDLFREFLNEVVETIDRGDCMHITKLSIDGIGECAVRMGTWDEAPDEKHNFAIICGPVGFKPNDKIFFKVLVDPIDVMQDIAAA